MVKVTNTLTYYGAHLIMPVKSFIVHVFGDYNFGQDSIWVKLSWIKRTYNKGRVDTMRSGY